MPPKKKTEKQLKNADVINFYELDDVKAFVTEAHNPNYNLHHIKVPFRAVIIGATGSGKTNIVLNLLKVINETFNKVELYCRSMDEALYKYLENKLHKEHDLFKITEGLDDFNSQDLNTAYDKENQTLVIFDDLVLIKDQSKISELFIRGRKLGVSSVYLTQKFFQVPTTVRGQCNYLFIRKISGKGDLRRILADTSLGATIDALYNMYQYCIRGDITGFLLIDLEAPQEQQYRKKFTEYLDWREFDENYTE